MKILNYIILGLILSPMAFGFESEEQSFVRKCYAQLTSSRIPAKSAYLSRAKAGEDPVSLCMEILNRASIVSNGEIDRNEKNSVGQLVLKNMHRLHSSFFSSSSYTTFGPDDTRTTRNYLDDTQPAFYITNSLFSEIPYDQAITTKTSLRANRTDNDPDNMIWKDFGFRSANCLSNQTTGCGRNLPKVINPQAPVNTRISGTNACSTNDSGDCDRFRSEIATIPFAPRGKLLGFRAHPGVNVPHLVRHAQDGSAASKYIYDHKNMNQNLGAGMIGDQVFVLSTHSQSSESYKANGAALVSRNWSKAVYEDVLCRTLPALRNEDVSFQLTNVEGSAPFRWANACLRCHVGMDQTAGYIRNLQYIKSIDRNNAANAIISTRLRPAEISSLKSWTETNDNSFYKQSPVGRLYYRDYQGKLIHKTGTGIGELAQQIAETDDYYICAAKNYYKHFINVDVALPDPGKAGYVDDESGHRAELIRLGLEFKEHKSLKMLVNSIFKSKFYFSGKSE